MAYLIDDILFAPITGIRFIAEKLRDTAMEEMLDEEWTRQEMKALYEEVEKGKISEKKFEVREEELVERLEKIYEYKEALM
jgi:isopropylmalate/homocitrate/citramalate synthase